MPVLLRHQFCSPSVTNCKFHLQNYQVTLKAGSTNMTTFSLDVDSTISSLLVQFIGDFTYESVEGPAAVNVESLVSITGAELFRINNVAAGRYTFNFDATVSNNYG